MSDGMIKLKAHAAYYRKCEADAMTPSQAAIAEWQAKALEHAIESIGALPDLAPKVKPLEWEGVEDRWGTVTSGRLQITQRGCHPYWSLSCSSPETDLNYETLEAAKAAAQAHYDDLILSALVAHGEE